MDKESRTSPRVPVSIKLLCAAAEGGALRILDLSLGGILARGCVPSEEGGSLEGTVHVAPASGERDVVLRGLIMRAVPDGDARLLGVRIESFDSPEGERAYKEYVGELYADS
jgi:hypothetical protein